MEKQVLGCTDSESVHPKIWQLNILQSLYTYWCDFIWLIKTSGIQLNPTGIWPLNTTSRNDGDGSTADLSWFY